ncbi:MAG: hypothetical protein LBD06_02935 [Candidatus Accumulibacter sp.]|nr:hypothetical protein [Accumulibacter sp.]
MRRRRVREILDPRLKGGKGAWSGNARDDRKLIDEGYWRRGVVGRQGACLSPARRARP